MNQSFFSAPIILTGAMLALCTGVGVARTFVIPHVLETSGSISVQANSFDTELTLTKVTSSKTNGAVAVELFLYDNAGAPLRGSLGAVCNPCQFELARNSEQLNLSFDELIRTRGGGFDAGVKLGYAVINTSGESGNLRLEGRIINSLNSSSNLSVFTFQPEEIRNEGSTSRAFVLPHILEKQGTISSTPYTFDTTIFMVYSPSTASGTGATAELYLYGDSGQLLVSQTGTPVCNPCQFDLGGGAARKQSVRIDDLIVAAGGFDDAVKWGFGVVVVGGSDPDGVALQGFVVNSHTGPFDLSVFGFEPQPLLAEARTMVIPHVLETAGTTDLANRIDTTIYATYSGGLAGTSDAGGAEVSLYLYDSSGQPLQGADLTPVCNPCAFDLTSDLRKQTIRIDDLITAAGGFGGANVKLGYGVITVGGADPDHVAIQGFVVNSHTGPFDLSVFGFEPQPLAAAARVGPPPPQRAFVIPHVLEKEGRIVDAQNTFDTTLYMTFASPPSNSLVGVTFADLYLFDPNGQVLRGATQPVCAPCSYQFTGPNQKLTISLEQLIQDAGGFDAGTKLGHGIVLLSGSHPDAVNLQGFVVNAHTGPFDLSVFGFEPQEVQSALRILPHVSALTLSNKLVLKWSTNSPGYVVEQVDSFSGGSWSFAAETPVVVGREYHVTNTIARTNLFFRLYESSP